MSGQDLFDAMRMRESDLQDAAVIANDDALPIDLMDDRIAVAIDVIFRLLFFLIPYDDILVEDLGLFLSV